MDRGPTPEELAAVPPTGYGQRPGWMTIPDVCKMYRVSRYAVKRGIHEGTLRASKPGRRFLLFHKHVEAWLKETCHYEP